MSGIIKEYLVLCENNDSIFVEEQFLSIEEYQEMTIEIIDAVRRAAVNDIYKEIRPALDSRQRGRLDEIVRRKTF